MSAELVQRQGYRIAYQRVGPATGPAAVLIQGLGLPGRMWLGFPASLLRSGYHVMTSDHRGIGASEQGWRPACTTAELADDVAAIIDHAGVGSALVVGISLGGMIAQQLALRHPHKVRSLVLAATSCGPPGRPPTISTMALLVRSLLTTSAITRAMVQRRLVHPATLRRRPQLLRQWSRQVGPAGLAPPLATLAGQLIAAATHRTAGQLQRIDCPTEVITGDHDEIVSPLNSTLLANRIPGARLTVITRAGHLFPVEWPAALPAAVLRVEKRARLDAAGALPKMARIGESLKPGLYSRHG